MSAERSGYCIVQISKTLMDAAADMNSQKAATAVGLIVASAVQKSSHQPCRVVKIEIVEKST